jgi:Domain of unknown function (DUF4893)
MRMLVPLALIAGGVLSGCGGGDRPATAAAAQPDWRKVATSADRDRLRNWRTAWLDAFARANKSGASQQIAAQGALFAPDRSLAGPVPPAGDYRCRVFKIGSKGQGPDFVTYPPFKCRIDDENGVSGFHKTGGLQRPVGLIFGADGGRAVFLGTMVIGDEVRAMEYGMDASRDMAGFVERVGAARWRLVLPYPRFESTLDVVEIVPVS